MKRFKDLEILGPDSDLQSLIKVVSKNLPQEWLRDTEAEKRLAEVSRERYFVFAHEEMPEIPTSSVCMLEETGRLYVPNIVPRESGELSIEQYNRLVDEFSAILEKQLGGFPSLQSNLTSDDATITEWVSDDAAELLRRFSVCANMSTGSSHPSDFKRWAEFIIQIHKEESSLDTGKLKQWLVEELGWPEEKAQELAIEYEFAHDLLNAYDAS